MPNQPFVEWRIGGKTIQIKPRDSVMIVEAGREMWFNIVEVGPGVLPHDGSPELHLESADGKRITTGLGAIIQWRAGKIT